MLLKTPNTSTKQAMNIGRRTPCRQSRVGFSPPKQQQAATTVKQRHAEWWAEAHPTADNRPTSRRSGKETESNYGYAKQSEKID